MLRHRLLIPWFFLTASTSVFAAESLEAYARRCDEAIGITVPDFICDAGTLVPTEHHQANSDGSPAKYRPERACDRPNQLNEECDPGSRFQVLPGSNERAFAVAHCRKQGLNSAEYGDIAVIQHNKENGATCFYQALADWEDDSTRTSVKSPLKGDVKAPSKGTSAWPWMTPENTARIGCVGCHDNGPIFRSPYLSRAMKDGKPLLPGAGDGTFNDDQPYHFVGTDFASWRAYKVEVAGNQCNECHRIGVSNILFNGRTPTGTARVFGNRATATSQPNKNPHSATSPIWTWHMNITDPPDALHSQAFADAAKAIQDCAAKFSPGAPLPNADDCRITQFTGSNEFAPPMDERFGLAVASWGPNRLDLFGVGTDGAMYHKAWDGIWRPSPSGWEHLGGAFTSAPAVVASGSERLDASGLEPTAACSIRHGRPARDGRLGNPWAGPSRIHRRWCPGVRTGSTSLVSAPMARCITRRGTAPGGRRRAAGSLSEASSPARLSRCRGRQNVWMCLVSEPTAACSTSHGRPARDGRLGKHSGASSRVGQRSCPGDRIASTSSASGPMARCFTKPWTAAPGGLRRAAGSLSEGSSPARLSQSRGAQGWLDVFGVGTDNSLFHRGWGPDTGWTAWKSLGGVFKSPPVVVSREANRLDILAIGRDAASYQKTWDGGNWLPSPTDWTRLGGGVVTAGR